MWKNCVVLFYATFYSLQADISRDAILEMQKSLMEKSIGPAPLRIIQSHKYTVDEGITMQKREKEHFCDFNGVTCRHGIVRTLSSEGKSGFTVHTVTSFPPMIRRIDFAVKHINCILYTRRLPRELRFFRAYWCELSGQVDLQNLPALIVEIHLRSNSCSGNLDLLSLPQSLHVLDLAYNDFEGALINNSLLPRTLQEVHLYAPPIEMNVVIQDGKRADKRVHLVRRTPPVFYLDTYE